MQYCSISIANALEVLQSALNHRNVLNYFEINTGLLVDIFCWGSRAPTIWISKGPKQNLKGPSIEIHYQFSNFGGSIGPSGKISQGPHWILRGPGPLPPGPREPWNTLFLGKYIEIYLHFPPFLTTVIVQAVEVLPRGRHGPVYPTYRKISNIRCTKFSNLNVSRFVLQLSLPNLMKPGVK